MMTRRASIKAIGLLGASTLLGIAGDSFAMATQDNAWFQPDEGHPHKRTWMAFGADKRIWGKRLLPEVQRNLAKIALAIAKYEPVSMLVRQSDIPRARELMGSNINLIVCPLNDIWIRDTGPVFVVTKNGDKAGVDFKFNGWGAKQECEKDAQIAAFVTQHAGVPRIQSNMVLEGGGFEVDGHGTAIIAESCVINENRNPGLNKSQCEQEFRRVLGVEKIIWLPGIKGKDITDGHTDFYARFARPGVVVAGYEPDPASFDHPVTKRHLEILRMATDAKGRKLEVTVLNAPAKIRKKYANNDFAAGYLNYYVCNGAVIAPEFGDPKADTAALRELTRLFPEREIVQVNIDAIAAGGGGIHCTTQQEPEVRPVNVELLKHDAT